MALREEFERQGKWLFRWRSYLPLFLIGLMLIGMRHFEYPWHSHLLDQLWEILCIIIAFFGLVIRALTIGYTPKNTSGRNTSQQIADTLNTTGMYSIVRHPLYVGNFFCWIGISMFVRVWWINIITILIFWLYYERIIFTEEEFLRRKFGEQFEEWAKKTPAFLPRISSWISPPLPFSFKNVLKREYSGLFAVIASFTVLEIIGDIIAEGKFELDIMWMIVFFVALIISIILRILKKKTKFLHIDGR
jgi:protein-S-isoprenylcysteine O-methyltransferase Ste14